MNIRCCKGRKTTYHTPEAMLYWQIFDLPVGSEIPIYRPCSIAITEDRLVLLWLPEFNKEKRYVQ